MRCPVCMNYVHQCGRTRACVPYEPPPRDPLEPPKLPSDAEMTKPRFFPSRIGRTE